MLSGPQYGSTSVGCVQWGLSEQKKGNVSDLLI
jgi:hypothetical protein